jgi:ubiquinone/menaquinone biosynthesis C-methylase UbiE
MVKENKASLEFNNFFKPYSGNVDNAEKQYFWKLSDTIIEAIIKEQIPKNISKKAVILDAGGGTGRWIVKLGRIYDCSFILYDLSKDMLEKAESNFKKNKADSKTRIMHGNLEDMKSIKSGSIDYIISIYNPISFVANKEKAANEFYRILKPKGTIMIMGQGFYNALYSKINNYLADAGELRSIDSSKKVRWVRGVPELNMFSKESMEKLLKDCGFKIKQSYGVPVFVQPGPEDFDPLNEKKSRISGKLEQSRAFFNKVLDLEIKYNYIPSLINRGMNILTVAKK